MIVFRRHTHAGDLTTAAAIKARKADRMDANGRHVTALRLKAEAARDLRTANQLAGGGE